MGLMKQLDEGRSPYRELIETRAAGAARGKRVEPEPAGYAPEAVARSRPV